MELDSIDHRYLLGAASDASVAAYDVQVLPRLVLANVYKTHLVMSVVVQLIGGRLLTGGDASSCWAAVATCPHGGLLGAQGTVHCGQEQPRLPQVQRHKRSLVSCRHRHVCYRVV